MSTTRSVVPVRLLALATTVVVMVMLSASTAFALEEPRGRLLEPAQVPVQGPRQVFSADLTVREGEVIEDSVVVYSGDVRIERGGRITGALVVMSGDVEIAEGAGVDGDLTAYSGNVAINGRVGGSVSALSGNITLGRAARVEGDLSVLSGRVERQEGAFVGGNLVQTPGLRVPGIAVPPVVNRAEAPRTSLVSQLVALMARLIGAVLLTAMVAAIVAVVYAVWPNRVAQTRATLMDHKPLSFVVGLFGNLTLLFIVGLLSITVCLLPVALIPLLALLAVNLVGWTVASQIVGERVVKALKQEVQPILVVVVGAVLLTGVAAILWALGSCFRPLGFLFMLGVASFGSGALIVPWLNRRGAGTVDSGPAATPPSVDELTRGEPVVATEAPIVAQEAEPGSEAEDAPAVVSEPSAATEANDAPSPDTVESSEGEDVFTRLRGVGPVLESKLKDAGLRTFAQLAAATPEEIAEIVGWTPERVLRSEIREQAARLSTEG